MNRPLKKVSDFVVKELAFVLETRPCELPNRVNALLAALTDETLQQARTSNLMLALMDLKFLEAGITHSVGAEKIPPRLLNLIHMLCPRDYSPVLTYHDLIEVNPADTRETRCFMTGNIGVTERFFYERHRRVEVVLERILEILEEQVTDIHKICNLDEMARIANQLGDMTDGHFNLIRRYFGKLPHRDYEGASGAHTFRLPLLEVAMWGSWLPSDYREEIERKLIYYPQGGQWRLKKALQEADKGQACKDLVLNGRNPSAYQGLVQLAHAIDHFRTAHILAVRKQIPEVMRNRAPGTSGNTAAGRFLSKRQADMAAVLQQLEGAFAEAA